jgi:hypothetical protein
MTGHALLTKNAESYAVMMTPDERVQLADILNRIRESLQFSANFTDEEVEFVGRLEEAL